MAQVFIEGFDLWGSIPTTGSTFIGTSSSGESLSLSSTVPFADTYSQSLCVQQSTAGTGYNNSVSCVKASLSGYKTQNIAGFWFRYTGSLPTSYFASGCSLLLQWGSPGSPCLCLGIDSSGVLHIINTYSPATTFASGTTQLQPNRWYFIEFQANLNSSISANTCCVRLNGVVEVNVAASTDTTDPNGVDGYTGFGWVSLGFLTYGAVPVNPGVYAPTAAYFDDAYVFDLTGGSDNALFGSEHVHSTPPSTLALVAEGYYWYPAASSEATFTGTASATALRHESIASAATFTGTGSGAVKRSSSASDSATFSYTAASTPDLPTGRVGWIGSRLSQLGNITPAFGMIRGRFIVASAADSFTGATGQSDTRVGDRAVAASSGALFASIASSSGTPTAAASDSGYFFENLAVNGHFVQAISTATFTGVAYAPPKARASDSFTFTGLALSGKNRVVAGLDSATFTDGVRDSKPTVFRQSLSDSFVFLVTYASVHDTSMPCAASDSFDVFDVAVAGGFFGHAVSSSDTASSTELVSVTFRRAYRPLVAGSATFTDLAKFSALRLHLWSLQSAATFSDVATFAALHVHAMAFSDSARFSDLSSVVHVPGPKTYSLGFADSAAFAEAASGITTHVYSVADSATFSDLAAAAMGWVGAAADSATFTGTPRSNQFLATSASDSAAFSVTVTQTVEKFGARDTGSFTDSSAASVLLPSGLTIPGGDQSAGLRQILFSPLSQEYPLSFAESPEGILLMANGVDAPIAWDGFSPSAWTAGVAPPDQVVWMTGSGSGSLVGRRWAYMRYVDVRGNYSNLSQISDPIDLGYDANISNVAYSASGVVIVTSMCHGLATGATVWIGGVLGLPSVNGTFAVTVVDQNTFTLNALVVTGGAYLSGGYFTVGSASISYAHVEVPTDPKIVRRQILRNLAGDASVFYVDIDTCDIASTSFSSSRTDEQLATCCSVPVLWTNRDNAANRFFQGDSPAAMRYGNPPTWKCALASYAGRIFAASDVVYSTGAAQASLGSPYVLGIGTGFTASFAGRLLYVNGSGQPPSVIQNVMVAQQILVLQSPYAGPSIPMGQYAIRPAPVERSLVYYSEPHLPEAWPSWNAFSVPETDDEITGLSVFKSFLFVLKERNIFKFAYKNDPGRDGYCFPCVRRGSVNNRTAVYVEDALYMLDEMGVHKFDGDSTEPISAAVDSLFRSDGSSEYLVDWTTNRTLWHASHDQVQHTIRWHLDLVGYPSLEYSVCYDYRLNQWWLESYAERVSASCLGIVSGYRRSVLGTTARRVMSAGLGTLDGVSESVPGTLAGMASSGDTLTITDLNANFPANLAGVPVVLAAGTGQGETAVVSSNTSTTLSLVRPLAVAPDTTTSYQLGGVSWSWKSSWRRISEDEDENPRDIEIVWKPTSAIATMSAELFYDHRSEPYLWAIDLDRDGISVRSATPSLVFDLTTPRGYAIQRLSGHRDPYGYGHHYMAIELSGAQGSDATTVYQLLLDGVE